MCKELLAELPKFLSDHVKEVEKEKDLLLKKYYYENVEESRDVENFFREYANTINKFLNTRRVEEENTHFPFVIIRSIVEVQDMDDMTTYRYFIVPPFSAAVDKSMDNASCLSPLGRALLFKSVNQQVHVEIPAGTLRYIIKRITVPEPANQQPQ